MFRRTGPLAILILAAATLLGAAGPAAADEVEGEPPYVFAWPFQPPGTMTPRGGTTRGPDLTPAPGTSPAFRRLREKGLSGFERDRRAILAMAGPYRVSFDFLEIVGYAPDYEPARPYRSWATEYVYVLADEGDFISLQHLLVMTFPGEDGDTRGPVVTKHWRQDWHYEAAAAHTYRGADTWHRETRAPAKREGEWLQTVWQVDDAPRYAAWGDWEHTPEYSSWQSGRTWRPLPRREHSVRDDYDVLVGRNRHTILPGGWVHEQRNEKVVLDGPGEIAGRIAREYGVVRYRRIEGFDFGPGDAYLEATAPFWAAVRERWDRILAARDRVRLAPRAERAELMGTLFGRAQAIADGEAYTPDEDGAFARETVDAYLAGDDAGG